MKILTFDIEDWFHILDNNETASIETWSKFESRLYDGVERILKLLEENKQKSATFFCLGWVAEKYPNVIKMIHDEGFHIASHSYAHQLAFDQTRDQFDEDLKRSILNLENITGKKITSYRAPGFSITDENLWAFDALLDNGIEIDCSVFPASRSHGGLPRYKCAEPSIINVNNKKLKSFPINTKKILGKDLIYSGGGYFRILPRIVLNSWFKSDKYIMTYFHPRDFDPKQPMVPGLSLPRKFKSYVGLNSSYSKLDYILKNNNFIDVEQADVMIDWATAPSINL